MEFSISHPVHLNRQGVRSYNEDYLFPEPGAATSDDRLFMVCDGVGGAVHGDQASRIVCREFSAHVLEKGRQLLEGPSTAEDWKPFLTEALRHAEAQMDEAVRERPDFRGMATTMTFVYFTPRGAVVAWAGDSRVYVVRGGSLVFRTEDHSLVNELYRRGEITESEMETHPRKNIILRAVSGSGNPTKVDVALIKDLRPGDRFLLCTDGVVDGIREADLLDMLSMDKPLRDIVADIDAACELHSRDNYTLYFFELEDVKGSPSPQVPANFHNEPTLSGPVATSGTAEGSAGLDFKQLILVVAGLALVAIMAWLAISQWKNDPIPPDGSAPNSGQQAPAQPGLEPPAVTPVDTGSRPQTLPNQPAPAESGQKDTLTKGHGGRH